MYYDVCVLGLGYIGLPTALLLADAGLQVVGVDIDEHRLAALRDQRINASEPGLKELLVSTLASGAFHLADAPREADAFVVAVPTPLTSDKHADLSFVHSAVDSIIPVLRPDDLVVIESTCPPRTTESIERRIVHRRPELAGKIYLAYCPERILPGDAIGELKGNDRTIGGWTPGSADRASYLYSHFCDGELLKTDATTAETVKLVENAYRDVNIAFANELSLVADKLGVDPWEVILLANRHPRVNVLKPGPGVGGHCIAIDPWFLAETAPHQTPLIKTAREVNSHKSDWVVQQVEKWLSSSNVNSVALLGLAYKPDIDDLRESPSVEIAQKLAERNPSFAFTAIEPNLVSAPVNFEQGNLSWSPRIDVSDDYGVAVWLVDHSAFMNLNHKDFPILLDFRGPNSHSNLQSSGETSNP